MKLEFRLLIVDDDPSGIREAIGILEDYLENEGFSMSRRIADDFSNQGLRNLARLEGKNYDLVMIDYNLGQTGTDGAVAALRLRRDLQYTDMVFYSSDPSLNLYSKLAEHEVSGVFIANRDELDTALRGLADTVIGKAVDLNHTRGIAMAEVAEMDVLMEETLVHAFRHADSGGVEAAKTRTIKRLREGVEKDATLLQKRLDEGNLLDVVRDSRLFTSAHKYQAIRRVARDLPEKPAQALTALQSYETDIIGNRNMLAHVKEDSTEDGETILRSVKGNVIIDDDWMTDFRMKLKEHRTALTTICEAISNQIDAAEAPRDSEECQP